LREDVPPQQGLGKRGIAPTICPIDLRQKFQGIELADCVKIRLGKLTLQTQLLPDIDQSQKLSATMRAFNATDSDGEQASGAQLERGRQKNYKQRQVLLQTATKIKAKGYSPKYTSQICSQCSHREKANRKSQSEFLCRYCGFETHADYNGALNVRAKTLVNAPMVLEKRVARTA
jgi:hypothetical protein